MPWACAEEICRRGSISKNHQLTNLNKCGKFHASIRNSTILALSRLANRNVPRSPSYGVYIPQLIRFARVYSNVDDFNNRNLFLTAKLLKQGYRYHKIQKAFSKFYHRHSELIVKYNIGLKTLLQQGISEPIFYGDLVYKFNQLLENLILVINSKR